MAGVVSLPATPIKGSRHDLSSNRTPGSTQVCLFCHTPHNANLNLGSAKVPLWNRYVDTAKVYTVYTSSSLINTPGSPGSTRSAVCLGCHDGTMATAMVLGNTVSDKHDLLNVPTGDAEAYFGENCLRCHTSRYGGSSTVRGEVKFGTNLNRMHPIAISYPTSAQSSDYRIPTDAKNGWTDLLLFNGRVECSTCHSVHDPAISPFLRKSNNASALCLSCHIQ